MNRFRIAGIISAVAAAVSFSGALAQAPEAQPVSQPTAPVAVGVIRVVIDDNPIDFRGAAPQKINGAIFVPLRGLFVRLGAVVQYHAETRTIEATNDKTYLILRVGDVNAFVNNATVPLAQPPLFVDGVTMVPLRFVAQAFGASVKWDPVKQIAFIHTHPAQLKQQSTDIVGQVSAVNATSNPAQISVRSGDQTIQAPVATDTLILLQRGTDQAVQSPLPAIQIGDYAHITRATTDGPATSIKVSYDEITGIVKDVVSLPDSSHVVLMDNAMNAPVAPAAPLMQDGKAAAWSDIKPGARVTVRTDPNHHAGYFVTVQAPPPPVIVVPVRLVSVESFNLNVSKPLKGGDAVSATLRGTSGGAADFSIAGVTDVITLKEGPDGVYTGAWIVPKTLNINSAIVTGRLAVPGGKEPVLIQAPQTITIDNKPPAISNLTPEPASNVASGRPRISATIDDGLGTGVDTASVHIFIDGLDVTVEAILTPHFVTFEPRTPLTDGEHTVRVVAADIVGNSAEASWKISVNARHDLVTSFESNVTPQSSHISMIRPLHLILRAQAGGRATYSVGSLVTNGPMKETSPGQYEADYTPDGAASAQNAPVTASFATASGASTTVTLDTAVTVDAPAAMRPTITDPKPNDVVPGHCVIAGIAAPNATVLVTVTFKSPAMGDLYRRTGKAASTEVLADETGHWRTEDLKLNAGGFMSHSGGTVYTATAVVVDATGQQSARDLIRFRQK